MARYFYLFVTLFSAAAQAALLQVSSTATLVPGGPAVVSDMESISENFVILITGATGSGYYSPSLYVSGVTNESSNTSTAWGASASVNWPVGMQAGDPFGSASVFPPSFDCPGSVGCLIPFTFGVPQYVQFVASTYAALDATLRGPVQSPISITSSVTFDGIQTVTNAAGEPLNANVQVMLAPEPGTLGLTACAALAGALVALCRRLF